MMKTLVVIGAVAVLAGCGCQKDELPEGVPAEASADAEVYMCEGEAVKVDFPIDTPEAYVYFEDDRVRVLAEMPSASGSQYSDGDVSFWVRDDEATFEMDGESMTCQKDSQITDSAGNIVPEDCIVWFDGCNNCQVSEDGMLACTRKACAPEAMEAPQCMERGGSASESQEGEGAVFERSVKKYSCTGEEYVVSRPDEDTVRITMPSGNVEALSASDVSAQYENAKYTTTWTKGGAMTIAEGAAPPAGCTLVDSDYFQTCKNAGGVWSEEQGSCFEDPATMADPEEMQN